MGRLAFVDHFDRVKGRIVRAIQAAVHSEAVAATAQNSGLPFRSGPPKVFVISSISGGTGSGMVLDVGYLVRKILRDLGLSDDGVCGILAHCTGRNANNCDLAVANAYACLSELHHYSNPQNAYPGAAACDLPPFAPEDAPFRQAYVVPLGENLESSDFTRAAEKLAKYLYCNAATCAGTFFDRCRGSEDAEGNLASADPAVRTFGLCQLGFAQHDVPTTAVDGLCKALVTRWQGKEREKPEGQPTSIADPGALLATQFATGLSDEGLRAKVALHASGIGLDFDAILCQLHATATREMGADPESYLRTVLEKLITLRRV